MTLIDIASDDGLVCWIQDRWCEDYQTNELLEPDSIAFRNMLERIWDHSWDLFNFVKENSVGIDENKSKLFYNDTPSFIDLLIMKCCSFRPQDRPSFSEIITLLNNGINNNISSSSINTKRDQDILSSHMEISQNKQDEKVMSSSDYNMNPLNQISTTSDNSLISIKSDEMCEETAFNGQKNEDSLVAKRKSEQLLRNSMHFRSTANKSTGNARVDQVIAPLSASTDASSMITSETTEI